jgi:hypothetical protein
LVGGEIGHYLGIGEPAHVDGRMHGGDFGEGGMQAKDGDGGDDGMSRAGQEREDAAGIGEVGGFAEDDVARLGARAQRLSRGSVGGGRSSRDDRVGGEDDGLGEVGGDGAGLALGEVAGELLGREIWRVVGFVDAAGMGNKAVAGVAQEGLAARRGTGEDEGGRRGRRGGWGVRPLRGGVGRGWVGGFGFVGPVIC